MVPQDVVLDIDGCCVSFDGKDRSCVDRGSGLVWEVKLIGLQSINDASIPKEGKTSQQRKVQRRMQCVLFTMLLIGLCIFSDLVFIDFVFNVLVSGFHLVFSDLEQHKQVSESHTSQELDPRLTF